MANADNDYEGALEPSTEPQPSTDPQVVGATDGNGEESKQKKKKAKAKGKSGNKNKGAGDAEASDVDNGRRFSVGSEGGHHEGIKGVKKKQALLVDPQGMKDKLKENLSKPKYDVTNFYWKTGKFQQIARHSLFENITLGVIAFNALWISIDTDCNDAEALNDADPIFIVAENLFCIYFTFEITIRFGAFEKKHNCMKDAWFVFDAFMVSMMIFETWIMFVIVAASGGGGQSLGNAGMLRILRLLRLSRMMRMARLLRSMPELLILIKGMGAAMRSVFFTLILLVLIIYVFAIYFCQMTQDEATAGIRETYFPSMAKSQHSLLVFGIFLDNLGNLIWDIDALEFPYHLLFPFYIFILLSTLTVMNMLIGVVCEVVSATAVVEKEGITMIYTKDCFLEIVEQFEIKEHAAGICDKTGDNIGPPWQHCAEMSCAACNKHRKERDNDEKAVFNYEFNEIEYLVSKEKFLRLFKQKDVQELLTEVDVDVLDLFDLVDTIFTDESGEEKNITFADLITTMLDQRTGNDATVKDLTDMQKYFKVRMEDLQDKCQILLNEKSEFKLKLSSRVEAIGGMVEKAKNNKVPWSDGHFNKRTEETKKKILDEQSKREKEIKERKEKQEEESRQRANQDFEEAEAQRALELQAEQAMPKKKFPFFGGKTEEPPKKE